MAQITQDQAGNMSTKELSIALAGGEPAKNTRQLSSGSGDRTPEQESNFDALVDDATNNLESLDDRQQTIMETFRDRRKLAQQGGEAQRELIGQESNEAVTEQVKANAREYISSMEGRGGFATKTAAVRFMEDSGAKRVRDLEKRRDSLLLEAKVQEAARIDNLITQEQEAITTARQQYMNDLFNIQSMESNANQERRLDAQEERNVAGFETPDETRRAQEEISNRQLILQESMGRETAERTAVREMASIAPDAGITETDDYFAAIEKYRNSETYKRNEQAAELELDRIEADIQNTRSLANNRGVTTTPGGNFVISPDGGTPAAYTQDEYAQFDTLANNVLNLISSENGKEAFIQSYNNAQSAEDKLNAIASATLNNVGAGTRTDFIQTGKGLTEIDNAIAALDRGVQTGALQSGTQYLYNIVGEDYDPGLTEINQYITAALQPYRSSITGAAWGRQETAEYNDLFGTTRFSPEELKNRLVRLKGIMQRGRLNVLTSTLSPFGDSRQLSDQLNQVAYPTLDSGTAETTTMFSEDDL